jgi:hypothetical protein
MEPLVSALSSLFTAANSLTPLALVGLTLGVLYIQIYKQPSKQELSIVKENHLHELPEVAANMRQASETLRRIEVTMAQNFATIISKIEGQK